VAGFSSSGRLGVDYVRIKGFGEAMSDHIKLRIGGLQPQRNTRMGAAIRHAARELGGAAARVRLLILGDGFPNDTGLRRPRRGGHAAGAGIEGPSHPFHALTVNLPVDPKLDQLCRRPGIA
jgi:hypothetical protein